MSLKELKYKCLLIDRFIKKMIARISPAISGQLC
jgi:hypothetical protein